MARVSAATPWALTHTLSTTTRSGSGCREFAVSSPLSLSGFSVCCRCGVKVLLQPPCPPILGGHGSPTLSSLPSDSDPCALFPFGRYVLRLPPTLCAPNPVRGSDISCTLAAQLLYDSVCRVLPSLLVPVSVQPRRSPLSPLCGSTLLSTQATGFLPSAQCCPLNLYTPTVRGFWCP